MQETWKRFVYPLIEDKKQDVDEDTYHRHIENQLMLLGWEPWKGEIIHKQSLRIGNRNRMEPDILVARDGEYQFVIEVKRPGNIQTKEEITQLESYMRQLRLDVGIYIGEHIELFYDKPNTSHVVSVFQLALDLEEKRGARFVELFSKERFSKKELVDFCEERIQEIQRQKSLNEIKGSLIANAQLQIAESLKTYLMDKYGNSFSEEEIKRMLATMRFTANDINGEMPEPNPIIVSLPPEVQTGKAPKKRTYDHTLYSLNKGAFLGKNKFVYAVVTEYLRIHPQITFAELERIFKPEYQGSFGVIRTMDYIREKNYEGRRYFKEDENVLCSGDGIRFAVSTEWGMGNISAIVELAGKLGFRVDTSASGEEKQMPSQKKEIKCVLTRNANAQGLFNIDDHSLTVLSGSMINPNHLPKLDGAGRQTRDRQFAEYTEERDGSRIVKTNVRFDTPSGAAQFCVGGSSNGWLDWKDEAGEELKKYRE